MATLGIDGLASGLDTTGLINSLMQIEAAPQTLLKSKQSTAQNVVTALQGINTRVASLKTNAEKAADASNWNAYKATSSATHVSATTTSSAETGSLTFTVGAVATRQVSLSAAVSDGSQLTTDNPPTLTLKKANGDLVSVTAASNSLSDMVAAINDSDMGIKATTVQVSPGSYRLQFTAGTTGTDGAFELYVGDEAAVNAATAPRLDGSVATTASNAAITLWEGTAYEQSFTQSSNTFADLMTGVSVTVSQATDPGESVTIDVATDATSVESLAKNLVGSLTLVLDDITSRTKTITTTNSDGSSSVKGGILTGDAAVRAVRDQLVQAATYPVDGVSPSTVGINVTKEGGVTFDPTVFASALADDPDGVAAFVQALAGRVEEVATNVSDPYEGSLSLRVKSTETQVNDMAKQIEDWDLRLDLRRSTLQNTYSQLEVTLSNLNAQSSWLAGQLASLPSISTQ